jgi:hypothetical protein
MKDLHHRINLICFLSVLFLNLMIRTDHHKWSDLSDPYDYLHQSKFSLTDKEFYFPHRTAEFSPRPFAIPLFYKMAESDPDRIIQMQKFVHSLTIFILVFAMMLYINKSYVRYIALIFTYLLMSWWNILGWTTTLLSESLGISLMFLWIATFLILLKKRSFTYLFIHILITILFSFTRDNWPYLLLVFYILFLVASFWIDKNMIRKFAILVGLSFIIFIVQGKSAEIGKRYRIPILNNLIHKIRPHEEYLAWFANHGMPCSEKIRKEYPEDSVENLKLFHFYKDSTYNELFEWIDHYGKSTYTKFLITHPDESLLLNERGVDLKRILAYNIGYIAGMNGYTWISYYLFPFFNPIILILLIVILLIKFIRKKELLTLFPIILTIVFLLNVFLMYNADSMEVPRHLFVTNIIIQFIGIFSVVLIIDSNDFNEKVKAFFNKMFRRQKT